jgi:hypothetical protein
MNPKRFLNATALIFLAILSGLPANAVSPNIVISQVYGGGGNSGATLKNDFIELYNRGTTAVDVTGWTVQYASASGTTWDSTVLSGTIQPGCYYLAQEAQGAGGTVDLPTPDATGSLALSATSGKVALVSNSTVLTGSCPSGVVDLVGYGTANCSEGSAAPGLTNTTAIFRANGGATDTDNNSADFSTAAPNPRNGTGAVTPTKPVATGSATPSPVAPGGTVLLVVTVTPGSNPTSTGLAVSGNLEQIGGSASQQFYNDATHGDVTAGDNKFSFQATVPADTATGTKSIAIGAMDAQSRTATTTITLAVAQAVTSDLQANMIFPQFADGGGYVSNFLLTNHTDTATTATLSYFSHTGTPLTITTEGVAATSYDVQVPAHGSAKVSTSGLPPEFIAGWVRVTTNPNVELGGNAVFQLFNGTTLFSEASVPGVLPISRIDFFADEEGGFKTGFALANPGNLTATGTLTLTRKDGTEFGTWPIHLESGNHIAIFLFEIFGDTAPSGRAEINLTSGYLAAIAMRYHTSAIFSTVSFGTPGFAPGGTAALFSPNGGVRDRLIAEINKAQSTIDIAIYSFTADAIRDALIAARNRGVAIRIIADTSQAEGSGSEIATLEGLGFNLKRMSGLSGGIMHNKVMIIDGKVLFTGSYNWSASAENYNFENAMFVTGSAVIQKYQAEFERLWVR